MDDNIQQQHNPGSLPQPVADNILPPSTPAQPIQAQPMDSRQQTGLTPSSQTSPPVAKDTDTLDAAWIVQVENLVKQTASDPFTLTQHFAKLKAQYIAGRYGKEIKQTDGKG